jgi:hypothetical protein
MIQQHILNSQHLLNTVAQIRTAYSEGFSDPNFRSDYQVPCQTEEEYVQFLTNLKDKEDLVKHIVEYAVGFGVFKAEGFQDGDQVLYVNGDLEVDITEEYLDTYFRYFEDGVEEN